jgi:replicative DNA helicase
MRKEEIILSALTKDKDFVKKAIPHMKADFFQDRKERIVYELIEEFYNKYQKLPSKDVLTIRFNELKNIPESEFDDAKTVLNSAFDDSYEYDPQWLLDETEKFCKERAVYNAIMKSVMIINGEDKKHSEGEIPTMLQDALSISFDNDIGHDYFRDAKSRFDFYHKTENRIKSDIDILNKITDGGLPRKILSIIVAMTGGGKSLLMCSLAADYLK